jgi:hypothetical protein
MGEVNKQASATHASKGKTRVIRNLIVEAMPSMLKAADLRARVIINRAFCEEERPAAGAPFFANGMRRC